MALSHHQAVSDAASTRQTPRAATPLAALEAVRLGFRVADIIAVATTDYIGE
jgi:hypothetical protein